MTQEKWNELKVKIRTTFKEVQIFNDKLEEPEVGERETVLFAGPLGELKLEYLTRPVVIDKRTHGSRRIGSVPEVEYIYSPDEFSRTLKAYKWDDSQDDWLEINMKESFSL